MNPLTLRAEILILIIKLLDRKELSFQIFEKTRKRRFASASIIHQKGRKRHGALIVGGQVANGGRSSCASTSVTREKERGARSMANYVGSARLPCASGSDVYLGERGRWEPKMATVHLSHLFIARETGTQPADTSRTSPRGYLRLVPPTCISY